MLLRFLRLCRDSVTIPLLAPLRQRALVRMLLKRDLATRTSGTLMGRLWPLLQPALQVLGFWFLFAVVYDMRNVRGAGFAQYMLLSMLPWLCFAEVLGRATGLFREFSSLFARSPFPLEVLPSLTLMMPALVYTPVLAITALWLLGPLAAIKSLVVIPLLLIWTLPLVLLCATTGLFVRDFGQALPFLLTLWMYLTPILYFPDMLPAAMRQWLWVNPMADWMALFHGWLDDTALSLQSAARLLVIWLLLLVPCWLWFRRTLLHVRELL